MRTYVVNKRPVLPVGGLYIGRGSKWGNPFVIGRDGTREDVVGLHLMWLRGQIEAPEGQIPPTFREIRAALSQQPLLCFCAPKLCHGDNYVGICEWTIGEEV